MSLLTRRELTRIPLGLGRRLQNRPFIRNLGERAPPVRWARDHSSTSSFGTPLHPLSDVVLSRIRQLNKSWFQEVMTSGFSLRTYISANDFTRPARCEPKDQVKVYKDGTFELEVMLQGQDNPTIIKTFYDLEDRTHYLLYRSSLRQGAFTLMDGTKNAWQPAFDHGKIIQAVDSLAEEMEKE